MQFIRKCEEAALNQKNQAQIYHHYVAAILSLETIPGGGAGARGKLGRVWGQPLESCTLGISTLVNG